MTDDLIEYILGNQLTYEQKCGLKDQRPTPYLPMTLKERNQSRIFQLRWYEKYQWMTGSVKTRKLYCYYCIIFGGEADWSEEGIGTIKNIDSRAQRHQTSKIHIRNTEMYLMLGKQLQVADILSEATRASLSQYNERVTINRRVMCRLIQATIFLSERQLPILCGEGYYDELLKFIAQEEHSIRDYLANSELRLHTHEAQLKIIDSIKIAVKKHICNEVSEAPFVSFQVDDMSDVSCKTHLSLTFRFCKDGKVVERFIGFYDFLKNKGAKGIADLILTILKDWNLNSKLVAQSCDGPLLMAEPPGGIQELVRMNYQNILSVHSVHHSLPLAMLYGCQSVQSVKRLVADLAAFDAFFGKSSQRFAVVAENCLKITLDSISHWNFRSRGVTIILAHYTDFIRIFDEITDSTFIYLDPYTYASAMNLKHRLADPMFVYLLFLFQEIFFFVDQLTNSMDIYMTRDVFTFQKEVKSTIENITRLRNTNTVTSCIGNSKNLNENLEYSNMDLVSLTYEIIDLNLIQLDKRFPNLTQLRFLELLNDQAFLRYDSTMFPDEILKQFVDQYKSSDLSCIFQQEALKNELWNVYGDPEKVLPPEHLLRCLYVNGLQEVYPETAKLLSLALTLPMFEPTEGGKKLKIIKSYLKKCVTDDKLSKLDILTIERSLLSQLSADIDFINEVIDNFSKLDNSIELQYKRV
ncbi:uncharacterized protein [Halyomorpha halys]|uniref:uncharacterized protein n=1 Tax=Halyomorpha halys TaxID=286706 RepID=UPI0006D5113D|nr:uncharacterized protein LOC106686466 [Halyomorpha halys]